MALAQSPDVVDDRCGMAGRSRGVARLGTGQVEPDQAAQAYLKAIAGDAAAVQRAILLYRVTVDPVVARNHDQITGHWNLGQRSGGNTCVNLSGQPVRRGRSDTTR